MTPPSAQAQYVFELADVLSTALATRVILTDRHLREVADAMHTLGEATGTSAEFTPAKLGIASDTLSQLTAPTHAPGSPELGLPGFWVIPVRSGPSAPTLYLWLLEAGHQLTESQVAHAERIARATLTAVTRANDAESRERMKRVAAPAHVDDSRGAVEQLVQARIDEGGFEHDDRAFAIALTAIPLNRHFATRDRLRSAIETTMSRAAATYGAKRTIVASIDDMTLILVAPFTSEEPREAVEQVVSVVSDLMLRAQHREMYESWVIGVSDDDRTIANIDELAWQAREAANLGRRVGWNSRTIHWPEVGQFRGISGLGAQYLREHFLPRRIEDFLEDPENTDLLSTLESFLQYAGNVQAVSQQTFLHRATVYNRLRRVEQLLGVDLGNGHDRLALHMGILSWRLIRRDIPPADHSAS